MGNLVGKLLIDEWFKMIAFGGFVLMVLSLTIKLQVDNPIVFCLGLTLLFCGVAEMAMRPYQQAIAYDALDRPVGTISGRMRKVNTPGIILYLLAAFSAIGLLARAWMLLSQA